jgi:hypothetical protein
MSQPMISINLTNDEALVLFDFLSRFDDSGKLAFAHSSEYLALQSISAQLDKTLIEPFQPDYTQSLERSRSIVSAGFDGDFPGPKC